RRQAARRRPRGAQGGGDHRGDLRVGEDGARGGDAERLAAVRRTAGPVTEDTRMARRRSRAADYLVYLVVRVLICVLQALPWEAALALARGLGRLAYRLNRRHRLVAFDNVRHAFPELDERGVERLVRATYEHFVTVAVEMMRLPRTLRADNYKRYTHWAPPDGEALGVAWARCGRPLLIL